jgi:hypothetical protein
MHRYFDRYRMAGYDIEIEEPIAVPLDIALTCCVKPGCYRSELKRALLDVFSNRDLPDGTRGFFHPDNFTFGRKVYLSHIYQAAMSIDGLDSILEVSKFERWGEPSDRGIGSGYIPVFRTEIVRLDNDPNRPENGKIDFVMVGGL